MAANIRQAGPQVQERATQVQHHAVANGTGVHQSVVPNQRRQDAGRDQSGKGQQDGSNGETAALAKALRNLTDTGIVRAVDRMTGKPRIPVVAPGSDNVLQNIGIYGVHSFALGSLIPHRWLRRYYKLNLGKRLRITGDISEEEEEQIFAEMTNARLNRPMNRDLLAQGYYDTI